jgi:chitodextrinase
MVVGPHTRVARLQGLRRPVAALALLSAFSLLCVAQVPSARAGRRPPNQPPTKPHTFTERSASESAAELSRRGSGDGDARRPPAPASLTVTGVTRTTVSLAWSRSNGYRRFAAYLLSVGGARAGWTLDTRATLRGLPCGTTQRFGVEALYLTGERSLRAEVSATTDACPDTTPPAAPTGLHVVAASAASVSVGWTAATDNVGVTGYAVSRDGTDTRTTAATQLGFDGLACGTSHRVTVVAVDAAGNRSAPVVLDAMTAACPTGAADLFVAPNGSDYEWAHLATTYDGTTLALYVNGVLKATLPVTGAIGQSAGPLRLGGNDIWDEWFAGVIDDVRVYDRALTPTEVQADMNAPVTGAAPGLVAAYSFDETSGGTASDVSGNGNVGTISGAAWEPGGKHGGALSFDGVDDWVTVADAPSLELSPAMTLEAWVKPSRLGAFQSRTVLIKQAPGALVYALYADTENGSPSGHATTDAEHWARGAGRLPANPCTDRAHPCLTFDHAYHAAAPGQVVEIAPGTYPAQTLTTDDAKAAATRDVVLASAPGAHVLVDGSVDVSGASHLTVRGLAVHGLAVTYPSDHVTLEQIDDNGHFGIWGASNVTLHGGAVYETTPSGNDPAIGADASGQGTHVPRNVVIDGVSFHDWQVLNPSDHIECIQIWLADGLTIRNSRFLRCAHHALFINEYAPSAGAAASMRNVTIENNFFDSPNVGFYAIQIRPANTAGIPCDNFLIRNNTFLQGNYIDCEGSGNRVENNILPSTGFGNCGVAGWSYAYNLIADAAGAPACGATNIAGSPLYVDLPAFDLHLAPGSPGIDAGSPSGYAPTDIDGQMRPIGAAADIGADERG